MLSSLRKLFSSRLVRSWNKNQLREKQLLLHCSEKKKKVTLHHVAQKSVVGCVFFFSWLRGGGWEGDTIEWEAGRKAEGRRSSFPTCVIFYSGEHMSQQSLSANMVCRGTKWRAFGYNHLSQNVWCLCLWGFGVSVLSNFFTYPSLSLPLISYPDPQY